MHSKGNIWDNYVITDEDMKGETCFGFQSSTDTVLQLKFVAKSTFSMHVRYIWSYHQGPISLA